VSQVALRAKLSSLSFIVFRYIGPLRVYKGGGWGKIGKNSGFKAKLWADFWIFEKKFWNF